jgi:ABC-type multidrug transport system fused ATPase/permease subunit
MSMLKTLLKEVKEYKRASVVTPVFMILEVLMETLIPFLMASIIDEGVNAGNMQHIYKVGGIMVVSAAVGLFAGLAEGLEQRLLQDLQKICVRQCSTISRVFLLPISIISVRQDW